jgi:hypothetical protein
MAERDAKAAEAKVVEANAEQATTAAAAPAATGDDPREANLREYGQYVASGPIHFGTALGYNAGDAVAADVVDANGWYGGDDPRVVKVGTKAHAKLREDLGLPALEG